MADTPPATDAPAGAGAPLLAELRRLAERCDADLAGVSAGLADILRRQLPLIVGELDAVAAHTESATSAILDACEALEAGAGAGGTAGALSVRIYEACCFQDIVGQRLEKVAGVLRATQGAAAEMLRVLGPAPDRAVAWPAALLSGPQGAGAVGQHLVDAMLEAGE